MDYRVVISSIFFSILFPPTREMTFFVAFCPENMFAQWAKKSLIEKKGYQDRENSHLITLSA
jgi:hypothetical protein